MLFEGKMIAKGRIIKSSNILDNTLVSVFVKLNNIFKVSNKTIYTITPGNDY